MFLVHFSEWGEQETEEKRKSAFEEHAVNFETNTYKRKMEHASASLTPRELLP